MCKLLLRNVFLGGIGVVAVSAGAMAQGSSSPAKPAESPDALFVHKAGEGDLAELEFSRLAADHAASPKVRAYAQRVVQEHGQSSRELAIIAAHENIALPDMVDEEHSQVLDALANEGGAAFDNNYITAMLAAHQQLAGLMKSSEAAVSTDELRSYIKKTLPVVEREQRLAQEVSTQ
jgi:putative membrane protein